MNKRKNQGITLIALVITIIILIILAGVAISAITGENGLMQRVIQASEGYKKEQAKEKLELVLDGLQLEKETNEKFDENKDINNRLQENDMQVEENIVIVDGYLFEIDRSVPKIIEELGKTTEFWNETYGKAKFVYNKEADYVSSVQVSINIEGNYNVQYNIVENNPQSEHWTNYTPNETFTVTKNGIIYGRIINLETNEIGYRFTGTINNIDNIAPQKATIQLNSTSANVSETIQAIVTQVDNEVGISISNCKYIINTNKGEIGVDSTDWNSAKTFSQNPQTINITQTIGNTYYLHVLSVDMAGNKTETISEEIKFKGNLYLNTGNPNNPGSGWITKNSSSGSYSSQLRSANGVPAYLITTQKFNMSEINLLKFTCGWVKTNGAGSNPIFTIGLVEEQTSTDWVISKSCSGSWSGYAPAINLDISSIKGEYYLKIELKCSSGSLDAYTDSLITLTGE